MDNDYKNRDYTLRNGKDAEIANKRQKMAEAQHNYKDSFVKAEQGKVKQYDGRAPVMEDRYMKFDATMMNNGYHAQELAERITAGLDKVAFPVRGNPDKAQD